MKSKIKYDPPNRPLTNKPSNDFYRKNYDKIFENKNISGVVKKTTRLISGGRIINERN